MDIFILLRFAGGLGLFLFGMNVLCEAMQGTGAGLPAKNTGCQRAKGLLAGTLFTAVIQSSSAATVAVCGLADGKKISNDTACGMVLGANIGTTVTAWLLSVIGIAGDEWYVRLLQAHNIAPVFAITGAAFMFCRGKLRLAGQAMCGFATLMYGMSIMSGTVQQGSAAGRIALLLSGNAGFVACLLIGTAFTAVIQSSSAAVGILQALATGGAIPFTAVIPLLLGQNTGTCFTALIASVAGGRGARYTALLHLFFNLASTVFVLPVFVALRYFAPYFMQSAATPLGIAAVHTAIKAVCVAAVYPFAGRLQAVALRAAGGAGKQKLPHGKAMRQ